MFIKIAVLLTGLINEKMYALPMIKDMFTYLEDESEGMLQFDFYCHFWDSEGRYPFETDTNNFIYNIPLETTTNIEYVKRLFRPARYKVNKYNNLFPQFIDFYKIRSTINPDESYKPIMYNLFNKQVIDKDYFINKKGLNSQPLFNNFWDTYVDWCNFIHMTAQMYSLNECLRMVNDTGHQYYTILKWRYDLLADYVTNFKSFRDLLFNRKENHFTTFSAWHGEIASDKLWFDINNPPDFDTSGLQRNTSFISISDTWFMFDTTVMKKMLDLCLSEYVNIHAKNSFNDGSPSGHHYFLAKTCKNLNIPIDIVSNSISSAFCRTPELLDSSLLFSQPMDYMNSIIANGKNKSHDVKNMQSLWGISSMYHTMSKFNF